MLLTASGLAVGYEQKQVLTDVDLFVDRGEIVAIIGHNGAGKSTLLKAVFGLLPLWGGTVSLDGARLTNPTPRELLRLGVAYAPQGNRVFTKLSVQEHFEIAGVTLAGRRTLKEQIENVLELFPALKPRMGQRAGTLSGGEKQMLALASALLVSPRLLLLDEPSLGLSPRLVVRSLETIKRISEEQDVACLIVEQKVREVLRIAHRTYVLRNGKVSFSGPAEDLSNDSKLREVYL